MSELEIDKATGFRVGTNNLVMSALESELLKPIKKLVGSPFNLVFYSGIVKYEEILDNVKIICGSYIHMIKTNDPYGADLHDLNPEEAREIFGEFDTVVELVKSTADGGCSIETIGKIKIHGVYPYLFSGKEDDTGPIVFDL